MRIKIRSLGPIREGEVDLSKKLLLFVGPNNSGKTFAASAIYGLCSTFDSTRHDEYDSGSGKAAAALLAAPHGRLDIDQVTQLCLDQVAHAASQFTEQIDPFFGGSKSVVRDASVECLIEFDEARERIRHLDLTSTHIRLDSGDAAVVYRVRLKAGELTAQIVVDKSDNLDFRKLMSIDMDASGAPLIRLDDARRADDSVKSALAQAIASTTGAALLPGRPTMFPAERVAISLFARELAAQRFELVNEIISNDNSTVDTVGRMMSKRVTRYSTPISDSIAAATRFAAVPRGESKFEDLAARLEADVLGGRVHFSKDAEIEFSDDASPDEKIQIRMASSSVKSLVSLVQYLRYRAQPGATVIIDEPELNLHPHNQRIVARTVAQMVNRGVRAVVSTHSDFFVRELSYLVCLGELQESSGGLASRYGYSSDQLLRAHDVSVAVFGSGAIRAGTVSSLGFGSDAIDREHESMNLLAQEILEAASRQQEND